MMRSKLSQTDLLLISIFQLSDGKTRQLRFEDIVVNAFKTFPDVFQLTGYPEYPNSNIVEKHIYVTLKPQGYVRVENRTLELTEFGLERAESFSNLSGARTHSKQGLTGREWNLWEKIRNTDGYRLHLENVDQKPLDIDVYAFYSISARTRSSESSGRIKVVNDVIAKASSLSIQGVESVIRYKEKLDGLYKEMTANEN